MNKNFIKWLIVFGGGLLTFSLFKPKKKDLEAAKQSMPSASVESFDDNVNYCDDDDEIQRRSFDVPKNLLLKQIEKKYYQILKILKKQQRIFS